MIGDLSYSLYLWHWPVIVFSAAHLDQSALTALVNACVSLLLAYLAFVVVERPIHHARFGQAYIRTLAAAAACVLAVWSGAAAFRLVPNPAVPGVEDKIIAATNDLGVNYAVGCHLGFDTTVQPDCAFGAVTSARRVVLFGDSHAAQWFSPLADAAAENGWRLETRTKTSCPAVEVIVWYQPTRSTYDECSLWRRDVLNSLASAPPELIVVASSSHYRDWIFDPRQATPAGPTQAKELWEDGALAVMDKLASTGASVIWIRDTPRMYTTFKDCLSAEPWDRCGRPRAAALDGMDVRSETLGQARVLDLSEELCSRDICQATEGGEIMYRDEHHLTASQASKYARYFADLLPADFSAGH